jgi:hypothetical protein
MASLHASRSACLEQRSELRLTFAATASPAEGDVASADHAGVAMSRNAKTKILAVAIDNPS